jgi:hypothetical protein
LVKYSEVALVRLKNNNPDEKFTPLIAPLELALTNFRQSLSDKSVLKAQREGSTISVDDLMAEFKRKALQREGLIRDAFGMDSKEYQEFYPQGTHEYTVMTKTNADQLMHRMATAYANHAETLPGQRRLEMEKLYNDYLAARGEQLGKKAGISGKQVEKTQGRTALEVRLQYNLLTIAREFIGNTAMYHTYFEHNLLFPYRHKSLERKDKTDDGDGSYVLTIPAGTKRAAEFTTSAGDVLILFNDGDAPLAIYTATTADAPVPANVLMLQPGEEKEIAAADLGPAGAAILLVNNTSSDEGIVKIALV